jgi:cytochrome oxidase assembly protein ShyY1
MRPREGILLSYKRPFYFRTSLLA